MQEHQFGVAGVECYRLNVSPKNSYVEALIPGVTVFESGAFGRY